MVPSANDALLTCPVVSLIGEVELLHDVALASARPVNDGVSAAGGPRPYQV